MDKYMIYMMGKSETRIEECVLFGNDLNEMRKSDEYQIFRDDGYSEEMAFELERISGQGGLPTYIDRS